MVVQVGGGQASAVLFRRWFLGELNAGEQNGSGFVVGVLGDEFPAKGAGEKGGGQLVHLGARLLEPRLDLIGQRKQPLHPSHDFPLLGEGRKWKM